MEYITKSTKETKSLGKRLATSIISETKPTIFALSGNLGSGKTTFTQGFAQGLGIKQNIVSPTFILMRTYEIPHGNFYHVDLYRLEKNVKEEVKNLGLTDIWGKNGNIVVVEWAEKIKNILPKNTKWLNFENTGERARKITIN